MGRLVRTPLAKLRMAANIYTAEDAARLLDCSRSHLLHIERGRYGASERLMAKMAKIYHVPAEKIHEAIRVARKDLARRIADSL